MKTFHGPCSAQLQGFGLRGLWQLSLCFAAALEGFRGFRLFHGVSAVRTVGLLEWLKRVSMGPWSRLYTFPCTFEEADGVDGNLVTMCYTSCQAPS